MSLHPDDAKAADEFVAQAQEPPAGFPISREAWEDDQQTKEILRKDIADLRARIARAKQHLEMSKHNYIPPVPDWQRIDDALKELGE